MATSLTNKQGGSIWTLRQAKSLNALGAEVETAIDGVANSQATTADFTIGTEAADVINVAVELQDGDGTAVSSLQGVNVGIGLTATAPSGGWAIGTDGAILGAHDANKSAWVQTEADGTFDLDITEAAGATWYMVVQLPDGKQVVSGAITFAA
jgi:hypothetical protein